MPRHANLRTLCLPALLAAVFCGLVIILVLYVPQPVGLANNGDFLRIIKTDGIAYANDDPAKDRFVTDYVMQLSGDTRAEKFWSVFTGDYDSYQYLTSQTIPVVASKFLNLAWNVLTRAPAARYSIVWLGFIYIAVFVCALYLIFRFIYGRLGRGMFIFAALAGLFVFCDQGYLLYFNSFYGEAPQYVSTFLSIGLFLRLCEKGRRGVGSYIAYYLAVILMAASKNAYAPVGILFGLLPLALWGRSALSRWAAITGAVAVTLASAAFTLFYTPEWIEKDTNFDAVFAGVLKYSATPEQDLTELGLDPSLAILQGYESYQSDYPIDVKSADFKAQFYDKISKAKIMEFYLKHPGRLWESMKIEAGWSKAIRPGYLANYLDPSSPGQQSRRFSLWETARGKIGVSNIWVILAVFALTAGVIAAEISAGIKNRRERLRRMPTYRDNFAFAAFLTALLLCAAYNFVIPYLTNGICDIAKHMFGFVALYDLILVILAGYAARMGRKLIRRLHRRNY